MFGVTINIDPSSVDDLTKALEFILNQPSMSKAKERYGSSPCQNFANQKFSDKNRVGNNKVAELEKDIKMLQNENANNQAIIQNKDVQISTLKEEKALLVSEKEREISKLKKSLESYSVSFGSDAPTDKRFFEVTNNTLEESMISSSSLYCATKKNDFYRFTINTEGPTKAAISNIEKEIEPFCNIQDKAEGANTINIVSAGKAKLIGSQLQIVEKTVISLIKQ